VKHRLAIPLAVLIAALAMSASAHGSIAPRCPIRDFGGGYETGDFSQWWLHQWSINPDPTQAYNIHNVGRSTARIVRRPVAQGRFAAKFQVFPTIGSHPSDRAEVAASQAESGGYPGQTWWYGWWTYFPGPPQSWWHRGGDWNAITQFFSTDNVPSQMGIGIDAAGYRPPAIYAEGMPFARKRILTRLRYNHWFHFLVHARWSTASDGYIEIWVDGRRAVPRVHGATLRNQHSPANSELTSPGMYVSQGIYRGAYGSTNTVIHDGFCRARSRRLVDPKVPRRQARQDVRRARPGLLLSHVLTAPIDALRRGLPMRSSASWPS
jgi:hypothetical protein